MQSKQSSTSSFAKKVIVAMSSLGLLASSFTAGMPAQGDSKFTNPPTSISGLTAAQEIAIDADGSHSLVAEANYDAPSGSLKLISDGMVTSLNTSGPWTSVNISDDGLRGYALNSNQLFEITDDNADGDINLLTDITPTWNHDNDDGTTAEIPLTVYVAKTNSDATKMLIETDQLELGFVVGTRTGSSWSFSGVQTYPTYAGPGMVIALEMSDDGSILYAATDLGELVKSENTGVSWTTIVAAKGTPGDVSLSVSSDGQVVGFSFFEYAGAQVYEAICSTNGGSTWMDLYDSELGLDIRDGTQFNPLPMKSVAVSADGGHLAFGMMGNPTLIFNDDLLVSPNDWELVGTESQGFIDLAISGDKTQYGMVLADGVGSEVRVQSTAMTTFEGAWAPSSFPSPVEQSFAIIDGETSDYVPSHVTVTYFTFQPSFSQEQHLCDTGADDFGASADVLGAPVPGGGNPADFPCSAERLLAAYNLDPGSVQISGRAILEPCPADPAANDAATRASELCIESLSVGTSTVAAATFNRLTAGPSFVGEDGPEGLGKHPGGRVSLWTSSTANSAGVGTYAANVAALMEPIFTDSNEDGTFDSYDGLKYTGISGTVTPYVATSNYGSLTVTDLSIDEITPNGGPQIVAWSGGDGPRCAFAENDLCGRIVDFTQGTKVKLEVRVPKSIGGFFKGRMKGPEVTVTEIDSDTQRISALAEFVSVPRVEHTATTTFLDTQLNVALASDPTTTLKDAFLIDNDGTNSNGNLRVSSFSSSPATFDLVEWLKGPSLADDRVSGFSTLWSFGTVGTQADPTDPSVACLADTTKVLGVVTSNSMVYQDSPPDIGVDAEGDTTLEYKVAGMHLEPTGSNPVQGTYDMILDSNVARCLYPDLSAVPQGQLSADIRVIEDTTEKASTVSVSEAGGWLSLSAYGFTFSTNNVQVSLKQAAPQSSGGTPAAVVSPVTTPPAAITPPVIPAGQSGAVLIGGVPANVTISPNTSSKALEIKGTDWSLGLTPDSAGTSPLNAKGELVLNPQGTTDLAGTGFQANSKASAFLIPRGATQVAALGITQANLRLLSTPVSLGEISVNASGAFSANLDLTSAKPGDYILQINGAAPDGKIRSISVAANVLDVALKGWTKKLTDNQAKVYVKNVVAGGKVQIFVNGKEIAWVNAVDETDPKLRKANGFNYLVRTINLVPGKNRVEIKVDGERERFITYTR